MTEFKQSGFGAVLRQRREELGLSLNDLAASTRVRKTYLQALEEENLQMLPGAAYAVGFLRIYARQLELPIEPLVAALTGERTLEDHAARHALGGDGSRRAKQIRGKGKAVKLLLLLILLLLAAAGYFYYRQSTQVPRPVSVSTPENSSSARPAHKTAVEQPAAAQPEVAPPPTTQTAGQGLPAVVPVELAVLPATGAIVRVLPLAAGTMKVSLDSQEVREYQLQPDQSLNWKVSTSLAVELSAPGLARVWVDQQEIAVTEHTAFILKAGVKPEQRP